MERVRDHIKKRHLLPPHCPRCHSVFESTAMRDAHLRMEQVCVATPRPADMIGVSLETKELLTNRKGLANLSEPAKWERIYETLFPGEPVPNPCESNPRTLLTALCRKS
jgi:hypothetical protein